jgi:hypothetical protein
MRNFKLYAPVLLMMGAAAMFACSNEETLERASEEEAETASFEAEMDAYFNEANDMSQSVDRDNRGGMGANMRIAVEESDFRLGCATITMDVDFSDFFSPKGSIWIDFGDGCEDENGNIRKGKIQMEYKGGEVNMEDDKMEMKIFMTNTFHSYVVNDVKIEGVNDVALFVEGESMRTTHKLTNGKVTWPDGKWASRNSDMSMVMTMQNTHDITYNITGNANGMTKDGEPYLMEIGEDLLLKMACVMEGNPHPTSGIKNLTVGEKQMVINYGDGACNKEVTLTINGKTMSHTLK